MTVGARRQSAPWLAAVLTFTAMLVAAAPGHARILAESRFDTDADGWVVKDLPYPSPGAPPAPIGTFAPVYHNAGGNPGGYLSLTDPTANTWYWYAPPKFLGDMSAAYGGTLSFDLVLTGTGTPYDEEDVILVGGGDTLVFTLPARPGPTFTTYHIGLSEAGWRSGDRQGPPATRAEMTAVLSSLTDVYIRGEYRLASDDAGQLDNVLLEGPGAVCDIELDATTFVDGDQVVVQALRLANLATAPLPVEIKLWIEVRGLGAFSFARAGADGSISLPAGFDVSSGPFTLFSVTGTLPRGTYAFSCRMLNPTTGAQLTEDLNPFMIQ